MIKRAVVTGATGFIGNHLVRSLAKQGWNVHALKRSSSSIDSLSDLREVHWHDVDSSSLELIWETIGHANVVYHLATNYGRNDQPASEVARTNLLFPLQMLELADRHEVPLFVATDTCFPDSYPYLRNYTLTKKQFAQWGRVWAEQTGRRFFNVALQHPFGPGDRNGKFVPWIIQQCLSNVDSIELTEGNQQKDFIYVADVIEALFVLESQQSIVPEGCHQIPCGTGVAISLRTFVEMVHDLTKSSSKLLFGAIPNREGEVTLSCANTDLLENLGWKATRSVADGIRLTIAEISN